MTTYCPEYEFYSKIGGSCVHCEPFCRLYPAECSRTPECTVFIADYYHTITVPSWAIGLIVICILLVFAIGLVIVIKFCPCDFLCKFGCMFSFKKKKRRPFGGERVDGDMKLPYQTKNTWTSQDPVNPSMGYDINAIRQRTIMDRFWASIQQYPPQIGVEEFEPLNSADSDRKTSAAKNSEDSNSDTNGTNGSLNNITTAMTMLQQQQPAKPLARPSLDNRAIIENYHFDRVTRQGSFRVPNNQVIVPQNSGQQNSAPNPTNFQPNRRQPNSRSPDSQPTARPVQKGRRTGLKNLLNPRIRAGASETTV